MEPITSMTYILTYFFGYYIGSDLYNYYIYRRDFTQIINNLDRIENSLNRLSSNIKV